MSVLSNRSTDPPAERQAYAGAILDMLGSREPLEVLQHLADSDLVWGWRVRLILAHDRPTITGYDQDLWATRLDYANSDPVEALETFGVLRRGNVQLIAKATPEDLQRVGVHAERGEESVAYLCRLYAGHDLLHLNQIARVRATVA